MLAGFERSLQALRCISGQRATLFQTLYNVAQIFKCSAAFGGDVVQSLQGFPDSCTAGGQDVEHCSATKRLEFGFVATLLVLPDDALRNHRTDYIGRFQYVSCCQLEVPLTKRQILDNMSTCYERQEVVQLAVVNPHSRRTMRWEWYTPAKHKFVLSSGFEPVLGDSRQVPLKLMERNDICHDR